MGTSTRDTPLMEDVSRSVSCRPVRPYSYQPLAHQPSASLGAHCGAPRPRGGQDTSKKRPRPMVQSVLVAAQDRYTPQAGTAGTSAPRQAQATTAQRRSWTCSRCTFCHNSAANVAFLVCQLCGEHRAGGVGCG